MEFSFKSFVLELIHLGENSIIRPSYPEPSTDRPTFDKHHPPGHGPLSSAGPQATPTSSGGSRRSRFGFFELLKVFTPRYRVMLDISE